METTVSNQGVKVSVERGLITLDKIYKADYQKEGTVSAQFRQVIKTQSFYPTKQVASNMQDNLFSTEEFGFSTQEFNSVENRVAWMEVPENVTEAQVFEKLQAANAAKATLYKVLSNKPILTNHQEYAIKNGDRTMDDFAEAQIVRYPEGTEIEGVDVSGQIALHQEKPQYRRVFFSTTPIEDKDLRTENPTDYYISLTLQSELSGASIIQEQKVF